MLSAILEPLREAEDKIDLIPRDRVKGCHILSCCEYRGRWKEPTPFQGVACCQFRCELPLQDSNLGHLIQSAGPRAVKVDNLTGSGVPTSIGALSVWHLCPLISGETLAKRLQRVLVTPS